MTNSIQQRGIIFIVASCLIALSFAFMATPVSAEEVPELVITQVVVDTENSDKLVGDGVVDSFEGVEIYNPTNQAINLKDYNFVYVYWGNKDDVFSKDNQHWPLRDNTIEPGGFKYIWPKQVADGKENNGHSVADFAAFWGAEEDQVILSPQPGQDGDPTGGLANGGQRVLAITKGDQIITQVQYNEEEKDFGMNLANVYGVPEEGSEYQVKMATKQEIASGQLREGQAPKPTPAEMPKTGMGGTSQAEGSSSMMWILGAISVAAMASTFFFRRKNAKQ